MIARGDVVRIIHSCDNEESEGTMGLVEGPKINVRFGTDTWWYCLDQDELEVL